MAFRGSSSMQAIDTKVCNKTGKLFEVYEQQLSPDEVGVICSECGDILEAYEI